MTGTNYHQLLWTATQLIVLNLYEIIIWLTLHFCIVYALTGYTGSAFTHNYLIIIIIIKCVIFKAIIIEDHPIIFQNYSWFFLPPIIPKIILALPNNSQWRRKFQFTNDKLQNRDHVLRLVCSPRNHLKSHI